MLELSCANSMQDKVCLVTGATSGIGKEIALGLAKLKAHVIIMGRNTDKVALACEYVMANSGNDNIDTVLADLNSLDAVREMAKHIHLHYENIDVLINNAAVNNNTRQLTTDGYEQMFGVNFLAHLLLTHELYPLLLAGSAARIINTGSVSHKMGQLDLDDLQNEKGFGFFSTLYSQKVYGGSKLAMLLFTQELNRRLQDSNISVFAVDPGAVATGITIHNGGWFAVVSKILETFFASPAEAAEVAVNTACTPGLEQYSGSYFKRGGQAELSPTALDDALAEGLWQKGCELSGITSDWV